MAYTRSGSSGPFLSPCLNFWLSNNAAVTQWGSSLPLSHWNLFLQSTSTMLQSLAGKHGRESTSGSIQAWPPNWDGLRSVRTRNWKAEEITPGLFVWAVFVARCPQAEPHASVLLKLYENQSPERNNQLFLSLHPAAPSSQVRQAGNQNPRSSIALM